MSEFSENLCVGTEFSMATTLKAAEAVGRHAVVCVSEQNKVVALNADRMFARVSCSSLRDLIDQMKKINEVSENLREDMCYGDPVTNTAHYDDMARKFRYGDNLVEEFADWIFLVGTSAELEPFMEYMRTEGWWALAGESCGFQDQLKELETADDTDHCVYVGVA